VINWLDLVVIQELLLSQAIKIDTARHYQHILQHLWCVTEQWCESCDGHDQSISKYPFARGNTHLQVSSQLATY